MNWLTLARGTSTAGATGLVIWASRSYTRQVRAGLAHPRLASWLIWTIAMAIGAAGAARAAQWPAAVLGAAGSVTCGEVLTTGWAHGTREFSRTDRAGLAAGTAGLALLGAAFISPHQIPVTAAVIASVATDLAAFIPTYDNALHGLEIVQPWLLLALGAILALAATDYTTPAGWIYPAYETLACLLAATMAESARRARQRSARRILTTRWPAVEPLHDDSWHLAPPADWHRPPLGDEPAYGLVWDTTPVAQPPAGQKIPAIPAPDRRNLDRD